MKYKDSNDICHELLQEMKIGKYAHCDRLPRETELAEHFGISRTRLRDTLALLEQEGVITRRHGVGTIINRHVLQVTNRMDMEVEFLDMFHILGNNAESRMEHLDDGVHLSAEGRKVYSDAVIHFLENLEAGNVE